MSLPAEGGVAAADGMSEEIVAVIAAAVAVARQGGMRLPAVTAVVPVQPAGSAPWAWAGRLEQMAVRRGAQRRPHSSR